LILADGEEVSDLVPNDHRIRLLCLDGSPVIGDKRNLGCSRAAGEIIAHWDDDDYSAPERLADQVGRLIETGKAVTGYRSMRFTDGKRWWLFTYRQHNALGTSLCYRKEWWQQYPFPPKHVGEDGEFTNWAANRGQLVTVDAGELMYARNHTGNTSKRPLDDRWKLIA
jgi:hypothetical protein